MRFPKKALGLLLAQLCDGGQTCGALVGSKIAAALLTSIAGVG